MKRISLSNFLKMSPDAPQYSDRDQHYYLGGVNPTYYNDVSFIQAEVNAPLIASNVWTAFGSGAARQQDDLTESTESTFDAYGIDTESVVSGFKVPLSSTQPFNTPTGTATSTTLNVIKCFAGYLFAVTFPISGSVTMYKTALPLSGTPGWSAVSSFNALSINPTQICLEPFLEYLMASYTDSSTKAAIITKVDSSFGINTGINLGVGWTITGMRNYNNKYMAISANYGNFNNNYLFLWDGIQDEPNYSIKMSGKYIDMKVIQSTLYVGVWEAGAGNGAGTGKTQVYYLKNTTLVPYMNPQVSPIRTTNGNFGAFFNFNSRLGMMLDSTDIMAYGDSAVGKEEFIISTGLVFNKFVETYNGYILGITSDTFTPYWYNFQSGTFTPPPAIWNNINYISKWIPTKSLSGLDIWYDSPPNSGTDAINVTIDQRGENIITGTETTSLTSITPSNFLNKKRTRLDTKGYSGDYVRITLTTVNSGAWRAIIRNIDLITK